MKTFYNDLWEKIQNIEKCTDKEKEIVVAVAKKFIRSELLENNFVDDFIDMKDKKDFIEHYTPVKRIENYWDYETQPETKKLSNRAQIDANIKSYKPFKNHLSAENLSTDVPSEGIAHISRAIKLKSVEDKIYQKLKQLSKKHEDPEIAIINKQLKFLTRVDGTMEHGGSDEYKKVLNHEGKTVNISNLKDCEKNIKSKFIYEDKKKNPDAPEAIIKYGLSPIVVIYDKGYEKMSEIFAENISSDRTKIINQLKEDGVFNGIFTDKELDSLSCNVKTINGNRKIEQGEER
jgi:hypothetical protein